MPHHVERVPYVVAYANTSGTRDAYGGLTETVTLDSILVKPREPPYAPEFVARYRQAQQDRNRRITTWVKEKLTTIKACDRPQDEFCFVVHGTMADPTVLDPALDPNDREPGESYLGEPQEVNTGAFGLARFTTLRSWLSQWSIDDARGDAVACGPDIAVPTLVLYNAADNVCTPSHAHHIFEALGCADKELHEIPRADHYYLGPDQREPLAKAIALVDDWLRARDLGPND